MQPLNYLLGFYCTRLAWLHGDRLTVKLCHLFAVGIEHLSTKGKGTGFRIFILHLRLSMNHGLMVWDVKVSGIDIRACRTEVGIEGQRLI